MNIPRSKAAKRYKFQSPDPKLRLPDGHFAHCIASEKHLLAVGAILTTWSWLEEAMISVMASLLSADKSTAPARQIFRSVVSAEARIKILKNLLEKGRHNISKSTFYDEVIDEFCSLNRARNQYAHGLWITKLDKNLKVFLFESSSDDDFMFSSTPRHVSIKELEQTRQNIITLTRRIHLETDEEHLRSTSPQKHLAPSS